jgi:hypothetical protein
MEWTSDHVIGVISALLPGFVAAWVFYSCTAHPKPSPFERVVQALIFMAFVLPITALLREASYLVGQHLFVIGTWTPEVNAGWSLPIAIGLGLVFAICSNKDCFHKKLRDRGWTKRTAHPSEWFSAFNGEERYVTLHLKDRRRIHGFPKQWPDQPTTGHFLLIGAEWLSDESRVSLPATHTLMIPAKSVSFVEIMFEPDEIQEPCKNGSISKEELNGKQSGSVPERIEGAQQRTGVECQERAIDGAPGIAASAPAAVLRKEEVIEFQDPPT